MWGWASGSASGCVAAIVRSFWVFSTDSLRGCEEPRFGASGVSTLALTSEETVGPRRKLRWRRLSSSISSLLRARRRWGWIPLEDVKDLVAAGSAWHAQRPVVLRGELRMLKRAWERELVTVCSTYAERDVIKIFRIKSFQLSHCSPCHCRDLLSKCV